MVNINGELLIGIGLSRGYFNHSFIPNIDILLNSSSNNTNNANATYVYKTGDLRKRLFGCDIEYLGRIDHQVKI